MSLLAPFFLIATPLLGLPVLLHFYKARRLEAIEWGAMQFLVDAVHEGRRWEKIEELLLMLLRVLALAALVFALARPMAPGSWLGGGAERDVVLIVDDSMSTAAVNGEQGTTVLDQIKQSAHGLIDNLGGEDRVQVMAASAGGRWLTADAVGATPGGQRRLHELIDKLQPTRGDADLVNCLRSAERLTTGEQSTALRVCLLTDGQRRSLPPDAEVVWKDFARSLADRQPPVAAQVVLCGGDAPPGDNLAVGRVEADAYTLRQNARARVHATVLNRGGVRSEGTAIEWLLDGQPVAKSRVAPIGPGAEATVSATFGVKQAGAHVVECRLDTDDMLPLDQSAELVLRVAEPSRVLIVERASAAEPGGLAASQLLMAALGFFPSEPGEQDDLNKLSDSEVEKDWRADFKPEKIAPERLAEAELSRYAAVIVLDAEAFERADAERLTGYVAAGGGVWLTLGAELDPDRFNALWHDDGEGLCPVAVTGLAVDQPINLAAFESEGSEPLGVTIHPPESDHPATRHLANTTALDIDKARLEQHWRLARETPLGDPVAVLLESGAGDPLAVERYLGQGRAIVQATPLDFAWGNLPRLKAFVVMVNDWLAYLAVPSHDRHNLIAGAPIVVRPPEDSRRIEAVVTTPIGDEVGLTQRGEASGAVFRYTQTTMPGMYRVAFRAGGETIVEVPFATARSAEESDLTRLTAAEAEQIASWSGVEFTNEARLDTPIADTAPRRQPLWWALLAGLIVLLVGELLLANHVGRNRATPVLDAS